MWWILGIGAFVTLGLKLSMVRKMSILKDINDLAAKIRGLRALARTGDMKASRDLHDLDRRLRPLETLENNRDADSTSILSALRKKGLYPPSVL